MAFKYAKGKIPPKLNIEKDIVEAQPTSELQSQLFIITESNLTILTSNVKKESGVAKFDGNKDFILASCQIMPKLDCHGDFAKSDNNTMKELAD